MPNKLRAKQHRDADWERMKEVIRFLWIERNLTIRQVRKELENYYRFKVNKRQLKRRILGKWNIRKYVPKEVAKLIVERVGEGRPVVVENTTAGAQLTSKRLNRLVLRYKPGEQPSTGGTRSQSSNYGGWLIRTPPDQTPSPTGCHAIKNLPAVAPYGPQLCTGSPTVDVVGPFIYHGSRSCMLVSPDKLDGQDYFTFVPGINHKGDPTTPCGGLLGSDLLFTAPVGNYVDCGLSDNGIWADADSFYGLVISFFPQYLLENPGCSAILVNFKDTVSKFPPAHINTLAALSELLRELSGWGEFCVSLQELIERAAESCTSERHSPHTASLRADLLTSNIVELMHWRLYDRWCEANVRLRLVIAECDRQLGPVHSVTLRAKRILCELLPRSGALEEALTLSKEITRTCKATLGANHKETTRSMKTKSFVYHLHKNHSKAEKLRRLVMGATERLYGADSPFAMECRRTLGYTLWNQNKLKEAEALLGAVLADQQRWLGQEHGSTVMTETRLSSLYFDAGRVNKAARTGWKALTRLKELFGETHWDYLNNVLRFAANMGKYGRGEEVGALLTSMLPVLKEEHMQGRWENFVTSAWRTFISGAPGGIKELNIDGQIETVSRMRDIGEALKSWSWTFALTYEYI